jgi:multiple sugar transport system substrate-binding protein
MEITMSALEISINNTVDNPEEISLLIKEFGFQRKVKIDVRLFDWHQAWTEFMKISIYQHGPVISETGDTWMGSLTARNCLRTFKKDEIAAIGGSNAFLNEMWQSCIDFDGDNVLAIPWSLDTNLVYYRRDLLEKAGVDESIAFASLENFTQTLSKLQKAGIEIPIALTTGGKSNSIVHHASSWVWKMGGEFISADGKQILFTKPETMAGLEEYFGLYRFIPPAAYSLDDRATLDIFIEGNAAITILNPPFLYDIKQGRWPKLSIQNIGIAVHPGVPFIGGSNLVIWNHIMPEQEKVAIDLIRYLTATDNLTIQFNKTGLIPARLEALNHFESDSSYAPLLQSLKNGRAYKRIRLWGLVEDRLLYALDSIWQKIFTDPKPDIEQIIRDALTLPEERLNLTLSQ